MKRFYEKGQVGLGLAALIFIAIIALIIINFIPILSGSNFASAKAIMEQAGYVVLTPADYASLSSRIDALKVSADAAVANAVVAATNATAALSLLRLHNENVVEVWPELASTNVTLTAGAGQDTWGSWAPILDSLGNNLTAQFGLTGGYLEELSTYAYSTANVKYIIEIAYGGAKTVVCRMKVRADLSKELLLMSGPIPYATEIYYRMQCEVPSATLKADFRYYHN